MVAILFQPQCANSGIGLAQYRWQDNESMAFVVGRWFSM